MIDEKPPASTNVYHIQRWIIWIACLLGVGCLAVAIALPLALTEDNEIAEEIRGHVIPRHDPFAVDIWDRWNTSQVARDAFRSLTRRQMYGQLQQRNWAPSSGNAEFAETYEEILRGNVGSLLNMQLRETNDEVQRLATEFWQTPIIYANDTIHGYATIFPVNIGMAAAWDPDLIYRGTAIAAIETLNSAIRWTFAPNLDIGRDPRWGRVSESCGEDPYLTGVLGRAYVKGFQDNGIAACVKHVTGYGFARGGRDYNPSDMDLSEMLNDHLQAMKPAILEAWSFMPSYAMNDGIPAHSDRFMINDVIRGQWGWDGVVVSDYTAVEDLQALWQAEDGRDSARRGLYGGVDMSMQDRVYARYLSDIAEELAPDGHTYHEYAELSARRINALKDRVGLFDTLFPEYTPEGLWCNDDHLSVALEAALKSIVLLENKDNTLPLPNAASTRLLLVGSLADSTRDQIGSWPGRAFALPECYPNLVQTYRRAFIGPESPDMPDYDANVRDTFQWSGDYLNGYTHPFSPHLWPTNEVEANYQAVLNAVENGNANGEQYTHILFFVGDTDVTNGETTSRTNLTLSGSQLNLMQDVYDIVQTKIANQAPIIPKLIGNFLTARAMSVEWEQEHLDALVYPWVGGHMGGPALRRVLFGEYDATGKLPMTIPRSIGQIPIYYSQANSSRDIFQEGGCEVTSTNPHGRCSDSLWDVNSGSIDYRSKYIDSLSSPRYTFGYGQHYATYNYGPITVEPTTMSVNSQTPIRVSFTVTRAGTYTGPSAEIVQLYVRDDVRSTAPPAKLLRRFERREWTADTPAEQLFEFELDLQEDFGFYTPDLRYIVEPGTFTIYVGSQSADEHIERLVQITVN